jgi:hypothetical protein
MGSFFNLADATHTEYLSFSQSSRYRSRVITYGSAASGRTWPSVSVTQDKSLSNKVFNPEVISRSKRRALLYALLDFREPAPVCQCDPSKGIDRHENRPWSLTTISTETSATFDRSLKVRSRKSCEAPAQEDLGEATGGRQSVISFP